MAPVRLWSQNQQQHHPQQQQQERQQERQKELQQKQQRQQQQQQHQHDGHHFVSIPIQMQQTTQPISAAQSYPGYRSNIPFRGRDSQLSQQLIASGPGPSRTSSGYQQQEHQHGQQHQQHHHQEPSHQQQHNSQGMGPPQNFQQVYNTDSGQTMYSEHTQIVDMNVFGEDFGWFEAPETGVYSMQQGDLRFYPDAGRSGSL